MGETGNSGDSAQVVLLVAGGPLAALAVTYLSRAYPQLVVLREEPEGKFAILRRRIRLVGALAAVGQAMCGVLLKVVGRRGATRVRIGEICAAYNMSSRSGGQAKTIEVGSVNSQRCRDALTRIAPDVVAVYGTRIIGKRTLECVDAPFINYHAGINPKYRGQQPAYWALRQDDHDHVGVTVHLVDEGVDTGGVLYQERVSFSRRDNINTHQYVQMGKALPLWQRAIDDALRGDLRPTRVNLPSRLWYPPTLWNYLWGGVAKRVW